MMLRKTVIQWCAIGATILLAGCGGGSQSTPLDQADGAVDAGRFLEFLNPQYSLPAGTYTVVAATVTAGETGAYTLTIETEAGTDSFTGSWSPSGGQDATSVQNGRHTFTLAQAGGALITLTTSIDGYLYLLDRNNSIITEKDDATSTNVSINLPASQIDSESYGNAYYATIDPTNAKDTLTKWMSANGFGNVGGTEYDVSFRDTKDLGYGRHMRARDNGDGSFAFFVDNYSVSTVPGFSYGPINLEALVARDRQHLIGTNAIEFSPGPGGGAMFAKFYNFTPPDENGVQHRNVMVDLDGRGLKSLPGACIVCHGGKTRPLDSGTGLFIDDGDVKASLHPFELETLEFSSQSPYTRAEQEATLKAMNLLVLSAYPGAADTTVGDGQWDGDGATEIIEAMYGGAGTPGDYVDDHVPTGWIPDPGSGSPPAGADVLYREVVGPHCSVCHSKQGTTLQNIVDFSSYDNFIRYAELIEYYVYDAGLMPASQLNFEAFWGTPEKAALLGSYLPNFSHGQPDGSVLKPGRPIADPGPDLRVNSPVTVSAAQSLFASQYQWQITGQPVGGNASFSATQAGVLTSTAEQPVLRGDVNGVYTVQLTVGNGSATSTAVEQQITIDSTVTAQADLRFSDIQTILNNCTTCHSVAGAATTQNGVPITGVPVYWNLADNPNVYEDVLQRVNFDDPERSQILLKASNYGQADDAGTLADNLHFGGLRGGFDINNHNDGNRADYDTFLNWIRQGAVR